MNEVLQQLNELQRILYTIADRTTRIENRLESMAHNLDRLNRESR